MIEISDEMLTAYLDGEADAHVARQIETALKADPSLASRMDALGIDKDQLKRTFDGLLEVAPPAPNLHNIAPLPVQKSFGLIKVAAAALLALGIGWFWGQSGKNDGTLEHWQDYAAAYHRLYVTDTLEAADFSGTELAGQLARASGAIGLEMRLDQIDALVGLTLKRVQVLGYQEGKIAHLAFVDTAGNPVALCISDLLDGAPDGKVDAFGMATAAWTDGQHSFYLIGGDDAALVESVAAEFAKG